ncbi:unnamed protein product [Linum trigynum]|uniref:PRONE domain-containing protein n=1 Tax=Linum trigynum TaxID=586398 RepID=A0AAV2FCK8_9ROSI
MLSSGGAIGGDEENGSWVEDSKSHKLNSRNSDADLMKERFAKLLPGEDMSGSGRGVCSAMAISNAITNSNISGKALSFSHGVCKSQLNVDI